MLSLSTAVSPNSDTTQDSPPSEWLLVVDDDRRVCQMIVSCLAGAGLEVVTATSGAEAIQKLNLRQTEPVMMLIDVLMPGIDGLTLAHRLQLRLKRTMLVFMSGHVTDRSLWPTKMQQVAFLVKPFRVSALLDLVTRARLSFHRGG